MRKFRQFADKAQARGLRVLLTLTGDRVSMASPAEYAAVATDLATQLKGKGVDYEMWNEADDTTFWANGPQPAAYAALLKAAYPAFKAADPEATVLVGGLVGNDYEFVEELYANGAKGSFDGVAVHTDTACLTTDPREYYREPNGRIGRYSFTGYREVRATMLAHGDDKPVWMTELGWSTLSATCERGGRAGTKVAGVSQAEQADYLTKAYGCLANDPYVKAAAWFNLARHQDGRHQRRAQPRPDDRRVRPQARLLRLPERRLGRGDPVRRHARPGRPAGHDPLARPTASYTSPRCRST